MVTPSVRFNAAIISSPPFDVVGEYDCFHLFSPGEVSTELLDELLLLVFLFGVINRLDNSMMMMMLMMMSRIERTDIRVLFTFLFFFFLQWARTSAY